MNVDEDSIIAKGVRSSITSPAPLTTSILPLRTALTQTTNSSKLNTHPRQNKLAGCRIS